MNTVEGIEAVHKAGSVHPLATSPQVCPTSPPTEPPHQLLDGRVLVALADGGALVDGVDCGEAFGGWVG